MRVMREESFGPVVGIMAVKDDDEAIRLMNDSEFGLTASLWTEDTTRRADRARIETGTVFMNRADYLDPALCWTGCKEHRQGRRAGRSSAIQNLTGRNPIISRKSRHEPHGNWSYPDRHPIRGRAGLPRSARPARRPGSRSRCWYRPGPARLPITAATLDLMDAAGLGRAMFADVDPNPNEINHARPG